MSPELQKCTENLLIQNVTLKNLFIKLHDDIDSEDLGDNICDYTQELRYIKKVRAFDTGEENKTFIYKINPVLGIRCVSKDDIENGNPDNQVEPILEIQAEFIAQYVSKCMLSEEEISQFTKRLVYFHIWPYWREVVQSSCLRLGIKPLVIIPLRV